MNHSNPHDRLARAVEEAELAQSEDAKAPGVPWAALIDGAIILCCMSIAAVAIVWIFGLKGSL